MNKGYLWEIIKRIDFYIRLADQKANYLLALHVAFASFIFSKSIEVIKFFNTLCCEHCVLVWGVMFILLLFSLSFIRFLYYFYKIISPRLKMDSYMSNYSSLIFWDIASSLEFKAFEAKIRNEKFVEMDIIRQIYINSKIASEKFYYVRKAYGFNLWLFLASGLFLMIVKFLFF